MKKLKEITVMHVCTLLLLIVGMYILYSVHWKIAVGVFFCLWGNNAQIKKLK